jgi:hypothetical protein
LHAGAKIGGVRRLVLMPDYTADPLWDDRDGCMVSLSSLPLSDSLKERLTAWREAWERSNEQDWATGEDTPLDEAFERERHNLWKALREELGSDYEVAIEVERPPGATRMHVIWGPGKTPEPPGWMK